MLWWILADSVRSEFCVYSFHIISHRIKEWDGNVDACKNRMKLKAMTNKWMGIPVRNIATEIKAMTEGNHLKLDLLPLKIPNEYHYNYMYTIWSMFVLFSFNDCFCLVFSCQWQCVFVRNIAIVCPILFIYFVCRLRLEFGNSLFQSMENNSNRWRVDTGKSIRINEHEKSEVSTNERNRDEDSSKFETIENFQQKSRTKGTYSSDYPHYFTIAPMEHSLNLVSKCNATLHGYYVGFILSTYYVHDARNPNQPAIFIYTLYTSDN